MNDISELSKAAQKRLNDTLESIHHSEPDVDFPNYLFELKAIDSKSGNADVILAENYIQSILERLKIPHIHNDKIVTQDYFEHLFEKAKLLSDENDVEIEIYIGGGVVRTMLANMYKFVHERKEAEKARAPFQSSIVTESIVEQVLGTETPEKKPLSETELTEKIEDQMKLKRRLMASTEFQLRQAALGERDLLLAPFVLGVGSDLDIYYEVMPKGEKLTTDEKKKGEAVAKGLEQYINELENKSGVRKQTGSLKHSILPNADVKEYHHQIDRALAQGGSLIDTLAFKYKSRKKEGKVKNPIQDRLRHPEGYQDILRDFFNGLYEYIEPTTAEYKGKASQKQSIRGLRPLLEMPFLSIKDTSVINQELSEVLDQLEKGKSLESKAQEQFDKMVRNANFQLAKNKPYRSSKDESLSLGLQIAELAFTKDKVGLNKKVRFLLPAFLQKMPLDKREEHEIKNSVKQHDEVKAYLMDRATFIKNHTDDGMLYHGTSSEAGLCVLRGGFIVSTKKQGTAVYGPGVYTTQALSTAGDYASEGLIIPMNINTDPLKIINWKEMNEELKENLQEEAIEKGYEHVFELLKDREGYGIDIIVNEHVIVQNQSAIDIKNTLSSILEMFRGQVIIELNKLKASQDIDASAYFKSFSYYKTYYELFERIGESTASIDMPQVLVNDHIQIIANQIKSKIEGVLSQDQYPDDLKLADVLVMLYKLKNLRQASEEMNVHQANLKILNEVFLKLESKVISIIENCTEVERILLNVPGYDDCNSLTFAIKVGLNDAAVAILNKYPELCAYSITEGRRKGHSVLSLSILSKCIGVAKHILNLKPELALTLIKTDNSSSENALTTSILNGNFELTEYILNIAPEAADHIGTGKGIGEGCNALMIAINKGDLSIVNLLLEKNPELVSHTISAGYDKTHNALTYAVKHKKIEIVELLLEKFPELSSHIVSTGYGWEGHNALTYAVRNNQGVLVTQIMTKFPQAALSVIKNRDGHGHNGLTYAIQRREINFAKCIANNSPEAILHVIPIGEKKGHNALTLAIENGESQLAIDILENCPESASHVITDGYKKGYNALTLAINIGNYELAKKIFERSPKSALHIISEGPYEGQTALTLCIEKDNLELTGLIMEKLPEAADHLIHGKYWSGLSPCGVAIMRDKFDLAKVILKKYPKTGATVFTGDLSNGRNALALAISKGNLDLVKFILEVDPGSTEIILTGEYELGYNILMQAVALREYDIAKYIIKVAPETALHVVQSGSAPPRNVLSIAIQKGDIEFLRYIFENGPEALKSIYTQDQQRFLLAVLSHNLDEIGLIVDESPGLVSDEIIDGKNILNWGFKNQEKGPDLIKLIIEKQPEAAKSIFEKCEKSNLLQKIFNLNDFELVKAGIDTMPELLALQYQLYGIQCNLISATLNYHALSKENKIKISEMLINKGVDYTNVKEGLFKLNDMRINQAMALHESKIEETQEKTILYSKDKRVDDGPKAHEDKPDREQTKPKVNRGRPIK